MIVRGLTLWQPWAWCVAWKGKRIENRPWHPWHGVTHVLIHAGKTWDAEGAIHISALLGLDLCPPEARVQSVVVATARIAGCWESMLFVPEDQRQWWNGPHGWVLEDVRPLAQPVACVGARGLWEPPPNVLSMVLEQVGDLEVVR